MTDPPAPPDSFSPTYERRAYPRFALRQPLACMVASWSDKFTNIGTIENVSAAGFGLFTARNLQPGDRIEVLPLDGPLIVRRRFYLSVLHARCGGAIGFLIGGMLDMPLTDEMLRQFDR